MKGLLRFRALMLAFLMGVLISFAIPRPTHSTNGPRTGGILVADLNPDKACGPRCVVALLRLANEDPPKYDLAGIYKLIGRNVGSVTSLADISNVLQCLGFSVTAMTPTRGDLHSDAGYFIVPVGKSRRGTVDDPLHFILVLADERQGLFVIDPVTLLAHKVDEASFESEWSGIALLASSNPRRTFDPRQLLVNAVYTSEGFADEFIDLGEITVGARYSHDFQITDQFSAASRPVIVARSCTCIDASLGKDATGNAVLSVSGEVKSGNRQLSVAVRDANTNIVRRYGIRVFGVEGGIAYPEIGEVELSVGQKAVYPVDIKYVTPNSGDVKFNKIVSDLGFVSAAGSTTTKTIDGDISYFSLVVALSVIAPQPSRISGTVQFVLATPDGEKTVLMHLIVNASEPAISTLPTKVVFISPKLSGPKQVRFKVILPQSVCSNDICIWSDSPLPFNIDKRRMSSDSYVVTLDIPDGYESKILPGRRDYKLNIRSVSPLKLQTSLPVVVVGG